MTIMDDASVQPPLCTLKFDAEHVYGYTGPAYSWGPPPRTPPCIILRNIFLQYNSSIFNYVMLLAVAGAVYGGIDFAYSRVRRPGLKLC